MVGKLVKERVYQAYRGVFTGVSSNIRQREKIAIRVGYNKEVVPGLEPLTGHEVINILKGLLERDVFGSRERDAELRAAGPLPEDPPIPAEEVVQEPLEERAEEPVVEETEDIRIPEETEAEQEIRVPAETSPDTDHYTEGEIDDIMAEALSLNRARNDASSEQAGKISQLPACSPVE
jgi:hypothetical protein